MYKFCVFAGTTEGRKLVEFLSTQPVLVTACVATEYGESLLSPAKNLTISARRLTLEEMTFLFTTERFDLVIDATHPYASLVTEHIAAACAATGTEYLRLLRSGAAVPDDAIVVRDIAEATAYLNTTEGNILLTTGSKELRSFRLIQDFEHRVYARVLPMLESLRMCEEAGLHPSHILAMQGPFSSELNRVLLRSCSARYLVTKDSGSTGGFWEKIVAAREAGASVVIIGRPPQRVGTDLSETISLLCERFHLNRTPQVTVLGIGPGNRDFMTVAARTAVSQADCLLGARRMVEAVAENQKPVYHAIAPEAIAACIREHPEHHRFVVALSGDVGFFSGAKKLLPLLGDCDVTILPGLSSMVYLCAKLGISYETVVPVSLHGREQSILPAVWEHERIFVLVGGEDGISKLCQELMSAGLGQVKVSVGERLSYPDEQLTIGTAEVLSKQRFPSLSVALIEHPEANPIVTHGLPDEAFLRAESIPMTKRDIRSLCLSRLQLTKKAVVWDIGAGTGSVAIEMALQAKSGHIYAVERNEAAVKLLHENVQQFDLENVTVVPGIAPDICEELPAPSHAFLGGTSGHMNEIIALLLRKNPNIRIVATAITLESVAELTACMKSFSETDVISIQISKSRTAGSYHLMTGQNPIYLFTMQGGRL